MFPIFIQCSAYQTSNACDPSSTAFTKSMFAKSLLGDKNAHCGISFHSISNSSSATEISAIPSGVTASSGINQNTVSWNNPTGATSYNLYWRNISGVTKGNGNKIKNVTSPYNHSGLPNGTIYYYIVTSENSVGESDASFEVSAVPSAPCGSCRIFVTVGGYNTAAPATQFSSPAGADAFCNSDTGKPTTRNYKALIVDSANRIASVTPFTGAGQVDWVFFPDTDYFRSDGVTPVLKTNSNGIFLFGTLANAVDSSGQYYTGLTADWTSSLVGTCSDWSDHAGGNANAGQAIQTGSGFINQTFVSCTSGNQLLCVEQ
ncbi:MAG: DUF1554 domain-containing protein [Leptospira sp.]|nr:DUF1554 domain-containing protein [Leptospira sp.]